MDCPPEYTVEPMTRAVAVRIDEWRYDPPYDFYDLDADPADRAAFVDESTWPDRRFAVSDADGLVGFYSFDPSGDTVDLGLGMAPDRTGEGDGEAFVRRALAVARERYDPPRVRLGVATFNERAMRVYERCGFERVGRTEEETNGGLYEFQWMEHEL
ncbi:GNAT family N-acetyltransferase [Halomarina rubra]|uniref:GNAT family N-acetyltransferase n=1 Tax=Halomarina rubra TaxID=2071873 RepID=A0ABD6AUX4_9EURY|nr:GNAT family protein [Halomarina rubra]